jgi:hypothetical protein
MSAPGRFCAALLVALSLVVAACRDDPPEKEMQQAQGAIDAARAAGADQYARDEYIAAQDALKHAREAVGQRDYRLALNNALDSREHAQSAAKLTADNKAAARTDADRALVALTAALAETRPRLKSPEAAQVPAKALVLRRTIADAELALQKARTAFSAGDYATVALAAREPAERLRTAAHDLDAAAASSSRHHH